MKSIKNLDFFMALKRVLKMGKGWLKNGLEIGEKVGQMLYYTGPSGHAEPHFCHRVGRLFRVQFSILTAAPIITYDAQAHTNNYKSIRYMWKKITMLVKLYGKRLTEFLSGATSSLGNLPQFSIFSESSICSTWKRVSP